MVYYPVSLDLPQFFQFSAYLPGHIPRSDWNRKYNSEMNGRRKRQRFCCNTDVSLSEFNDCGDDLDFTMNQHKKQKWNSSETDDDEDENNSQSDSESQVDSSEDEEDDESYACSEEGNTEISCNGNQDKRPLTDTDDPQVDSEVGASWTAKDSDNRLHPNDKADASTDCPICLCELRDQLVGEPEKCRHAFCFNCIKEWSKNVNSCPIDRLTFNKLFVKSCINSHVIEELYIENVIPKDTGLDFEDDPTFCQVCDLPDREDRMLLCDNCDHGYHLECLDPPLLHIPSGDWFCPRCAPTRQSAVEEVVTTRTYLMRRRTARTAQYSHDCARLARAWFSGNSREFYTGRKRKRKPKRRVNNSSSKASRSRSRKRRRTKTRKKSKAATKKKNESGGGLVAGSNGPGGRRNLSMLGSASLEPTLSFNLRGNPFDLDEFCEEPPDEKPDINPDQTKPDSSNPDVLSSIIQGFGSLDPKNVTIARDGSLIQKKKYKSKVMVYSDSRDAEQDSAKEEEPDIEKKETERFFDSNLGKLKRPTAFVHRPVIHRQSKEGSSEDDVDGRNKYTVISNGHTDIDICSRNKIDESPKDSSFIRPSSVSQIPRTVSQIPRTVSQIPRTVSASRPSATGLKVTDRESVSCTSDIKSWRSHSNALSYRPLPCIEDFKSFKIPKVRKIADKLLPESLSKNDSIYKEVHSSKENGLLDRVAKKDCESMGNLDYSVEIVVNRQMSYSGNHKTLNSVSTSRLSRVPGRLTPRVPLSGKRDTITNMEKVGTSKAVAAPRNTLCPVFSRSTSSERSSLTISENERHVQSSYIKPEKDVESKGAPSQISATKLQPRFHYRDSMVSDQVETSCHMRPNKPRSSVDSPVGGLGGHDVAQGFFNSKSAKPRNCLAPEEEKALIRRTSMSRIHRFNYAKAEVKRALKPHYMNGNINKDEYKFIMKKCVDKIIVSSSTIEASRVERLVWKYICRM